ncbi:MAG: site-2 protease family protein, partial [Bacteroidia bacterium]
MDILVMVGQMILALSILVGLHEWGHYITARMFGIRVEKFYIFFDAWGKKIWSKKIGDTEYGIGWLPLGGYVKIAGMIDESLDTDQMSLPAKDDEFRSKPAWQR